MACAHRARRGGQGIGALALGRKGLQRKQHFVLVLSEALPYLTQVFDNYSANVVFRKSQLISVRARAPHATRRQLHTGDYSAGSEFFGHPHCHAFWRCVSGNGSGRRRTSHVPHRT